MKVWIARTLLLGLVIVGGAGCERQAPAEMRVGTNVWPGYEGLYLAEQRGYFEGTSTRMIAYPSASTAIRDFRAGQLEAIALTMDEALLLASENVEFRIVLVFDISNGGDVIIANEQVPDLPGIKGKRIGLEASALGAFMLSRALDQAGLTANDIVPVHKQLNEQEGALVNGEVDAVVTFNPVAARLLSAGYHTIFDSTQIPGEIVDVLLVRSSILDQYPAAVVALLTAYFKALAFQERNLEQAVAFLSNREGVSPEQYLESLEGLIIPDLAENQRMLGPGKAELVRGFDRLQKVMRERNLLQSPVPTADLIDGTLIQKVTL